jgi:SpoVK/Ycf46/Vps4 family AAA+-type ATPase
MPDVSLRETAWERALERFPLSSGQSWTSELANQFHLTPGQIHDAAAWVVQRRAMAGDEAEVTRAELYAACRKQSHHKLTELAVKIEPHYHWDDLVLPLDKRERLRELCDQVVHRQLVFGDWGFGRKLSQGRGISALFAGPSGTGKTMAAEVIAHELQLDLYKIDLAGVVNKYIGETEKNLAQLFARAEHAEGVLLFDEADSLFGKRTDVKEANDRFANAQTNYLLQRIESFEGIAILTSNSRARFDSAFTRRLDAVVEFAPPGPEERRALWIAHLGGAHTLGTAALNRYAANCELAGGHIRNAVFAAAVAARDHARPISEADLTAALAAEYRKLGKPLPTALMSGSGP